MFFNTVFKYNVFKYTAQLWIFNVNISIDDKIKFASNLPPPLKKMALFKFSANYSRNIDFIFILKFYSRTICENWTLELNKF